MKEKRSSVQLAWHGLLDYWWECCLLEFVQSDISQRRKSFSPILVHHGRDVLGCRRLFKDLLLAKVSHMYVYVRANTWKQHHCTMQIQQNNHRSRANALCMHALMHKAYTSLCITGSQTYSACYTDGTLLTNTYLGWTFDPPHCWAYTSVHTGSD